LSSGDSAARGTAHGPEAKPTSHREDSAHWRGSRRHRRQAGDREDHHPEGALGSAVLDALTGAGRADLTVRRLAIPELPGSGTSQELLDAARISAGHIAAAARSLLG
jgi:transketolase C-terminal domain/subunit